MVGQLVDKLLQGRDIHAKPGGSTVALGNRNEVQKDESGESDKGDEDKVKKITEAGKKRLQEEQAKVNSEARRKRDNLARNKVHSEEAAKQFDDELRTLNLQNRQKGREEATKLSEQTQKTLAEAESKRSAAIAANKRAEALFDAQSRAGESQLKAVSELEKKKAAEAIRKSNDEAAVKLQESQRKYERETHEKYEQESEAKRKKTDEFRNKNERERKNQDKHVEDNDKRMQEQKQKQEQSQKREDQAREQQQKEAERKREEQEKEQKKKEEWTKKQLSWESQNFGGYFIWAPGNGHQLRIQPKPYNFRNGARWVMAPGLANPADGSLVSFQSSLEMFSSWYIRAFHSMVMLHQNDNSDQFKRDATWKMVPCEGVPGYQSFESLAQPGHFLRHANFVFGVTSNYRGPDSCFRQTPPL